MTKQSSEKTAHKGINSTTAQGRVIERIIALMHEHVPFFSQAKLLRKKKAG